MDLFPVEAFVFYLRNKQTQHKAKAENFRSKLKGGLF